MRNLAAVADWLQNNVQTEPVVYLRFSDAVADSPIPEPETDPEPTQISLTCGVNEVKQNAEIKSWGQSIGADYTCLVTLKAFAAATGLDASDPEMLDSLCRDRVQIRGVICTVMKGRLTGWTGSGYTWLTIGAKRIER